MGDDDALVEQMAAALQQEFGAFLAHDPHKPERFWPSTARAVLAAVADDIRRDERDRVVQYLIRVDEAVRRDH